MRRFVHLAAGSFLVITVLTALLALTGVVMEWLDVRAEPLRHLEWLLGLTVAEIVAITMAFTRKGLRFIPRVTMARRESDALDLMSSLIASASSATIYSNRGSYLKSSEPFRRTLLEAVERGASVELLIHTIDGQEEVLKELSSAGVRVHHVNTGNPPYARFTLVNEHRSTGEVLAIARGSYPKHEITVFDHESGPQVIALAREVVRQARRDRAPWTGD